MAVESWSGITDPFDELWRAAPAAALIVRDYIKGLEAEAGSARTLAARAEADRRQSVETLEVQVVELRQQLRDLTSAHDGQLGLGRLRRRRSSVGPTGQGQ